ncbi:hypothetical protein ITJ57_14910 [Plantibacter sp. VKM Ac-2880]|uniref:hypothetical protein n=1 Tax=Plantibacter sp. VKM Ac-2880 TaxID=2783827 RepID=UPI00188FEC2C|nr:hypothetical protein [Plantibacter sp. VKM Ac-2880]
MIGSSKASIPVLGVPPGDPIVEELDVRRVAVLPLDNRKTSSSLEVKPKKEPAPVG